MIRILITGASRGLGLEFTKQYLERGDYVIATCRQPVKAKELERLQKDFGNNLEIEQLDVTSEKSKEILYQKLLDKSIEINLLINNAGIISGNEFSGNRSEYCLLFTKRLTTTGSSKSTLNTFFLIRNG